MPYESDLALRLPPHSPSVSVSAHVRDKPCRRLRSANASIRYRSSGKPDLWSQLPPGGSLEPSQSAYADSSPGGRASGLFFSGLFRTAARKATKGSLREGAVAVRRLRENARDALSDKL